MNPGRWNQLYRLATSPLRLRPDFIIPGEAKCGTTSLYRYLARHPDIRPADVKEPHNFITYGESPLLCRMHYPMAWTRWGRRFLGRTVLTGEATANYLARPAVAQCVRRMLPDVKLIVMFRNPVRRAFSDYAMMRAGGWEPQDFAEGVTECLDALADPRMARLVQLARATDEGFPRYILRGLYAESLKPWLDLFPREHFLFIRSEDFFHDPASVLDTAFHFLGLPPFAIRNFPVLKKGSYDAALPAVVRERLATFYRGPNAELYCLVNRDFGWENEASG